MNDTAKLTFKILALCGLGMFGFYQLTAWSAPGHQQAAALIGLVLTTFGVVAASLAMKFVVVTIALLRMLGRVFQGRKPMVINAPGRDPLDLLGRILFVAGFMALSAVVGACAGFVEGGQGIVASAAAFAAFGTLLAILVPADVVFADDVNTGGTISGQQIAENEAGRQAGEPTILFADRVVKDLREKLFEDQRKP